MWRARRQRGVLTALASLAVLAGVGLMACPEVRAASIHGAVSHATAHRRIVMITRGLGDRDGDGFAGWLGGGDCDDGDPEAFPFSPVGDPCLGPAEAAEAPVIRTASDAVGATPPQVVVLVTIDAFRCGFGGAAPERAELEDACPELTQLSTRGLFRPDGHTVYPATAFALRAIHRTSGDDPGDRRPRMADVMGALGYFRVLVPGTRLVVGDEEWRGTYDVIREDVSATQTSRSCTAHELTQTAIEAIGEAVAQHEHVFAWVHYFDPHAPYARSPEENLVLSADLDRYVAEVRRTDAAIGELARALESLDTVLFVTADHGEEFGEHGGSRHGANLYETSTRIPMIAWRAGAEPRSGLPHILPAGGDQVGDYLVAIARGAAFETRDRTIMSVTTGNHDQWAIVSGHQKLIYYRALGYTELFDLEADPFERSNLADGSARRADGLLRLLYQEALPLLREHP